MRLLTRLMGVNVRSVRTYQESRFEHAIEEDLRNGNGQVWIGCCIRTEWHKEVKLHLRSSSSAIRKSSLRLLEAIGCTSMSLSNRGGAYAFVINPEERSVIRELPDQEVRSLPVEEYPFSGHGNSSLPETKELNLQDSRPRISRLTIRNLAV